MSSRLLFADLLRVGAVGLRTRRLRAVLSALGITIILVTHDAGVAGHAKRAIRMRDGLIESGAFGVDEQADAKLQPI